MTMLAQNADGKKVWLQTLDIFGRNTEKSTNFVPFRYQGQYYDEETGLSYNRFRYYDDNTGQYISQDPIGLAGNNPTLYGYVENVNSWIDVFGLDKTIYRYMGDHEAEVFESTGRVTGCGGETTFATDLGYYKKTSTVYGDTLYSVTITDDAYAQLEAIGVRDNSLKLKEKYPNMPESETGWMKNNARFKTEKKYFTNIQMGSENGAALAIINNPNNRVSAENMKTKKSIDLH